jgi:hypothetical protein
VAWALGLRARTDTVFVESQTNSCKETWTPVFRNCTVARFGVIDRWKQVNLANLLRSDTPKQFQVCWLNTNDGSAEPNLA